MAIAKFTGQISRSVPNELMHNKSCRPCVTQGEFRSIAKVTQRLWLASPDAGVSSVPFSIRILSICKTTW